MKAEEENYNFCTKAVLSKLDVTRELFQRTEKALMADPLAQMELLEKGIETENPDISEAPEELTKNKVIELIKDANDKGFEKYKDFHPKIFSTDPMLAPVIISCLSHDHITKTHGYSEHIFKGCMFNHKVFDDPELMAHMQTKQIEMMQLPPPPGMQAPGMPGMPGGMPPMPQGGMPPMPGNGIY